MKFIISPAKKMNHEENFLDTQTKPEFLHKTEIILDKLNSLTPENLKSIWKCNDSIAELNVNRIKNMNFEKQLSPAVLSYEGIQYQYMAPNVFNHSEFLYIQEHLRILSGFYGILKPFDGVCPYRLEMAAKLSINGKKNLYDFWSKELAESLMKEQQIIVNLASKEYSKSILPHLEPNFPHVTIIFAEIQAEGWKEKATLCKMARGLMVRWATEQNLTSVDDLKQFSQLNFQFSHENSTKEQYIFLKKPSKTPMDF